MSDEGDLYGGVSATQSRTISIHTDLRVRCWTCGKLLFIKATRPWSVACRCKTVVSSPPGDAPLPIPPPVEQRGDRRRQSVAARSERDRMSESGDPERYLERYNR